MIKLKARFDNPDAFFWPGQFVRVRLVLRTIPDALLVPSEAVVKCPQGTCVFLAGADAKAELRPVKTGKNLETRTLILAGLQSGGRRGGRGPEQAQARQPPQGRGAVRA